MRIDASILRWLAALASVWAALSLAQPAVAATLDNAGCLTCHDGSKSGQKIAGADGKPRPMHAVKPDLYGKGVHGKLGCVDCHQDITDNTSPHQKAATGKADCAGCHEALWDKAKADGKTAEVAGLGRVIERIAGAGKSVHARKNKDDPTHANAVCSDCHDSHTMTLLPKEGAQRDAWRLTVPERCGTCHDDHLDDYTASVHGKALLDKSDPKAAICTDCHAPHAADATNGDVAKLFMVGACSGCHVENSKSYADTYHGQITRLGYANTAKCFNCHGSHDILGAKDPKSKVHPDNRLKTCQKCHKEAPEGFVSFQPHGNAHDFKRYPEIWIATKFMVGLLAGTFAFFWIHLLLWLYREVKERQAGITRPHIQVDRLGIPPGKQFQRFSGWWRLGHLLFAVSLMILTLTGMTLLYSGSAWAPVVMKLMGGPKIAAIIHRVNAVVFVGVFIVHLIYILIRFLPRLTTFKWFGPDSLIPGLQDLKDVIAMFKWFLGKGSRPVFDRWTYWEKFDYWAPFWGVAIVGVSGLLMWFPNFTAKYLPGWVFNVAAITHGEEAFLAAVFLFTVHFFNNHFRPEKFPLDTVMFTGSVPLEHFARDHPLHYQRLVASGELDQYLVDAPSRPMALGSKILGAVLIAFGLLLLALILVGFFGS